MADPQREYEGDLPNKDLQESNVNQGYDIYPTQQK